MSRLEPPPDAARRRRRRRLFAAFACLVGAILIILEILALAESGSVGWFWLIVGGCLFLLGLAEFVGPQPPG